MLKMVKKWKKIFLRTYTGIESMRNMRNLKFKVVYGTFKNTGFLLFPETNML